MDSYEQFLDCARKIAQDFRRVAAGKRIKVVTHYDCDGICSGAILINALKGECFDYSLRVVQQITAATLEELSCEDFEAYVFTDLGSSQLSMIEKHLGSRIVFILDHHMMEEGCTTGAYHLNPHMFGIDGSCQLAGSGVTYLFCAMLDKRYEDAAHLAVIGAIGDVQENDGFGDTINSRILERAVKAGTIEVSRGLRLYGYQTRPLHKCLEYSSDPFIPGVSGSECAAIQFLHRIGIEPKRGEDWIRLTDLSQDESRRLVEAIIIARSKEEHPEAIFSTIFTLAREEPNTPLRDAKEFSTLINSCGRLDRAELGIRVCLGEPQAKEEAMDHLLDYRKEIVSGMNWFYQNMDSMIRGEGYIILNARDRVKSAIIGTLASIFSKSNDFPAGTLIMSMARTEDDTTKISLRICGNEPNADLKQMMEGIITVSGGTSGGHKFAAGAIIPTEIEDSFIHAAMGCLSGSPSRKAC